MDTQTEAAFIAHLARATQGQTLVVVTHRPSMLALVERIVVVEDGRIVADGPKETILARLAGQHEGTPDSGARDAAAVPAAASARPARTIRMRPVREADATRPAAQAPNEPMEGSA